MSSSFFYHHQWWQFVKCQTIYCPHADPFCAVFAQHIYALTGHATFAPSLTPFLCIYAHAHITLANIVWIFTPLGAVFKSFFYILYGGPFSVRLKEQGRSMGAGLAFDTFCHLPPSSNWQSIWQSIWASYGRHIGRWGGMWLTGVAYYNYHV